MQTGARARRAPSEAYGKAPEPHAKSRGVALGSEYAYLEDPKRKIGKKARLALNREQGAAMIGRNGNMQVRQCLQPGSWASWRLGVKCTTLKMHSTGTVDGGIFMLVRLCSPALVFCRRSCRARVPSIAWALARPRLVAIIVLQLNGKLGYIRITNYCLTCRRCCRLIADPPLKVGVHGQHPVVYFPWSNLKPAQYLLENAHIVATRDVLACRVVVGLTAHRLSTGRDEYR